MQGAARGQRAQRNRGRSARQRGDGGSLPTQKVGFEPHSPVCGASVRLGEQQFVVACVHASLQKHQSTATEHQACTWPMTWPRGSTGDSWPARGQRRGPRGARGICGRTQVERGRFVSSFCYCSFLPHLTSRPNRQRSRKTKYWGARGGWGGVRSLATHAGVGGTPPGW